MKELFVLLVFVAYMAIKALSSMSMANWTQPKAIGGIGIDVLPGKHCNGDTALLSTTDGQTVFKYSHKKGDEPKSSPKGEFYGMYRMESYDDGGVKAIVTGNCCWEYYSEQGFDGESLLVGYGELIGMTFQAKSVRIVKCPTRAKTLVEK